MRVQRTLAEGGFEAYRKATRRDVFLAEMDRLEIFWKYFGSGATASPETICNSLI